MMKVRKVKLSIVMLSERERVETSPSEARLYLHNILRHLDKTF